MKSYQELFDSIIQEKTEDLVIKFICRKFKESGITLNDNQIENIRINLREHHKIGELNIDDSQIDSAVLKLMTPDAISVDLNDTAELDRSIDVLFESFPNVLLNLVHKLSPHLLAAMDFDTYYANEQKDISAFEQKLRTKWDEPISLLEMFLITVQSCYELFEDNAAKTAETDDLKFHVLTHLHARSCQIGLEILTLLKSGFADGAYARWRTLHEIAVVAMFISQSENDVAERYLAHDIVERFKLCEAYCKYAAKLQMDSAENDYEELKKDYEETLAQYGNSFKNDYGWAAKVLNIKRPTLKDIEESIGMDRMRPYYLLACQNVHASVKGAFFRLGLHDNNQGILLSGPSIYGLAEAGQGTALSLMQISTVFLTCKPTLDRLVACDVINILYNKVSAAFVMVEQAYSTD